MVYRYESDEDALHGLPQPGADPSAAGARRAPAGPSPSRFPTPDLPPVPRAASEQARAVVPAPPPATPVPEETAPVSAAPTRTQSAEPAVAPQPDPAPAVEYPTAPAPAVEYPTAPAPAVGYPTARTTPMGGRLWQMVVGGAAVLVLLAICGLGTAAVLLERESTPDPQSPPSAPPGAVRTDGPVRTDLDSRDTDPLPLTAREVFPGRQLVLADGQPAYQVLKTHSSASCAVAATDDIADLLVRLGCNQVVRGTVRAPDGGHLATAGLLNLTDLASAERARERIRQILQHQQGRFLALEAGDETKALTTAAARVAWQVRGHYIAYCLVVRADGQPIDTNDPKAKQVLNDMVELHLDQTVLERRTDGDLVQPDPNSTGTLGTDPSGSDDD
ncbi:hypothetical protein [Micromonospora sagamiensis]|uniref:Uncharacterized protein n=1 Tax=Micromonospora sagamiensis TaxID=47875 RepID=A0A562W9Z2_9ACTN|nr:hypothetical protein [Micromonospora sagamiensis]TWJ27103.1 hypothetical protein JD81_00589 [Micromonospora sagamiensis]BCL14005.1 hypothetical protein GCM10017556_17440 [Micromonospora sagamiensis]